VRNGVIPYCQANSILVTAYSPVEEGRLVTSSKVEAVAAAHQVTPFQVALAWLVQQPGVITIPMSQDPEHLRQNLQAADINLSQEEMETLTG
jgi:diketogulonate reductase-like aldo/keto reductase